MKEYKEKEIMERRNKVYKMAKNGFLIPEIAAELHISAPTVRADLYWLGGIDLLKQISQTGTKSRNNKNTENKIIDLMNDNNIQMFVELKDDYIFSFSYVNSVQIVFKRKLRNLKLDFLYSLYSYIKKFNDKKMDLILNDINLRIKQLEEKNASIKK